MLRKILFLPLLITGIRAACSDYYSNLQCTQSNPTLLQVDEGSTYSCTYDGMNSPGAPPIVPLCNIKCPSTSQLIAYLPDFGSKLYLTQASFDSATWTGTQTTPPTTNDLGSNVQFGCLGTPRCGPWIDDLGAQHVTICNVADTQATCNEDLSLAQCTCGPGYTGPTCSLLISMLNKVDPKIPLKPPAALLDVMPLLMAFLTPQQKKDLSWTLDEIIDSIDYELKEVDYQFAFTQIVDDVLGNCYTFNYANKTNSFDGLYHTRFAGQSRDFSIMVKLDPTEQVAWIESAAISTYIHAPGTPPTQGVLYSLRAASSDVIAMQKSITNLIDKCIKSRADLKQNYYADGDYTTDGCYSACYQDKVLEKCGCMDARYKKAD
ncbi:hypothetical protein PENTCL1PPCAC_24401, partial [Pristionchus entomophagus]